MVKNLQVFAARALPGSRICTGCVPQCKPRVPQGSLSNSSILPTLGTQRAKLPSATLDETLPLPWGAIQL